MAKMCRTCEFARPSWWCGHQWTHDPICILCDEHKPRETPLLVDVLAEALTMVWSKELPFRRETGAWGSAIYLIPRECRMVRTALARYKEEVGDA